MENLKLTSIRVGVDSLESASAIAKQFGYFTTSDVLRVAMWVGLKVITPRCFSILSRMMWEEDAGKDIVTLEDVLRAAGVND